MTGFDQMLKPEVFYQGRLWDAPFTDQAMPADLTGAECDWCETAVAPEDDAVKTLHAVSHLECLLCASLGNVAHHERRCSCYRGDSDGPHDADIYISFREEARATLRWLLDNNRGRFKPA